MEYGLIGAKLGHSWSVPIHARLGDYDYRLYERSEEDFLALLKSRAFKGLNVTIPYKKVALTACDALSGAARDIGCVNTLIVRPDGSLYGHNTDIGGFIAMARRAGVEIAGKKVVILGSGGTSLTATAACRRLGAGEIITVSRRGPVDYAALYRDHADAQVLVNTTPVGMFPDGEGCPADISRLPGLTGVLDVIYNPDRTRLILDARDRGIPCSGGFYMLVEQARLAAELFTGQAIDPRKTEAIYRELRASRLNLVLTGMPGCGKSSVGAALAKALKRPLINCDEAIERATGKTIPEIFAQDGEAAFRLIEARIIAEACAKSGQVIATGGGAILREENVRAMRQSGRVVLLLRDLEALPMEGRPLSKSPEALKAMWAVRGPRYLACADARVDNNGAFEDTLRRAKEAFYEAVDH